MKRFQLVRPTTVEDAAAAMQEPEGKRLKGGGIDLLDLMKERVEEPDTLVGLSDVEGFDVIAVRDDGSISIGAGATLSDLAASDVVRRFLPSLAHAAGQAASLQIRNRATIAGNVAQQTRCGYYRHASFPCLLRDGGNVCPVRQEGGVQETAGIFHNETCASAHPSSLAPVLGSLDATFVTRGGEKGEAFTLEQLFAGPDGKAAAFAIRPGSVIERVEIPPRDVPQKLGYAEVRQKAAFDWALASCAVRVVVDGGKITEAGVWLGSLAPAPLRAIWVEQALVGKPFDDDTAAKAGEIAPQGATPLPGTRYKVQLARVAVKRALLNAMGR